jgi:class 3 adenylate cyclase
MALAILGLDGNQSPTARRCRVMTIDEARSTAAGGRASPLLAALNRLHEVEATTLAGLADEALADWQSVLSCARQLRPLLGSAATDDHELRNLTGALRGYTEMLLEVLDGDHDHLRNTLERVQAATLDAAPSPPGLQPADAEGRPREATSRTVAESLNPGSHLAGDPGFILAVDDREENRELLARYLSRSGHFVVTARGGREALDLLENADVDVVLLDRLMPGMDGREVLRRIKSDERWRATPVIMISGEQDMEGIVECIEAGADDYLFKPFNPVLLQARIKAGIERKRWHDREQLFRQQLERNERFIRATFGRYLSDDIVTDILERPEGLELGGDQREVTIMMSDIRGFTTLSEQHPARRVVAMLNRYLGAMTDIILEYGGTIDEFLGDAILAVFGAPRRHDDDADRAARCALAMQQAMEAINRANAEEDLPTLAMGIALNTGTVIAGNIGSERRSKYGFVGHAMNVTSRIEDVTGRGEILLAESTRAALRRTYDFGAAREINARGIDERLTVYPLKAGQA